MLPRTFEEIARQATDFQRRIEALEHQRSGANRLIDSVILTAPVASITFSNIPNIYDHLLILYYIRNDTVTTTMRMRFNADAGNNYDYLRVTIREPAVLATVEGLGTTFIELPAMSAAANVFDEGMILINNYANSSNQKPALANATWKVGILTTNLRYSMTSGWWRSNNPITSITISASIGNFASDSRFDLYGIQGGE